MLIYTSTYRAMHQQQSCIGLFDDDRVSDCLTIY